MAEIPARARPGAYIGTTVGGAWWRRYRRDGFLARGNGQWWLDGGGLHFHRYLTKRPLVVPMDAITGTSLATHHAGRWALGYPFLVVHWRRGDLELASGFLVSRSREETEAAARSIEAFLR